jgi:hypothetical protein
VIVMEEERRPSVVGDILMSALPGEVRRQPETVAGSEWISVEGVSCGVSNSRPDCDMPGEWNAAESTHAGDAATPDSAVMPTQSQQKKVRIVFRGRCFCILAEAGVDNASAEMRKLGNGRLPTLPSLSDSFQS